MVRAVRITINMGDLIQRAFAFAFAGGDGRDEREDVGDGGLSDSPLEEDSEVEVTYVL
jgi:hypothetical protein